MGCGAPAVDIDLPYTANALASGRSIITRGTSGGSTFFQRRGVHSDRGAGAAAALPRPLINLRGVMGELEHKNLVGELKADADGGTFEGAASVFGNLDSTGDIIEPGAFGDTLAKHKSAGTAPQMLWQHDPSQPIGVWTSLKETAAGLMGSGQLVLGTQRGKEAHALLKAGALTGFSIGYEVAKGGAERTKDGGRRLTKLNLWEVSLVTFPANSQARVSAVKAAFEGGGVPHRADVETLLRQHGFSERQAKRFHSGGVSAAFGEEGEEMEMVTALEKLAERFRQ